ncbi:hypothetical protein O3P69_019926 [Scylla paramamosain]|uniref:Uncharacterized protein n=1 Tax=Scylla paramamosain TaxID=85552 RepID=A0AAW0SK68_SCYPA
MDHIDLRTQFSARYIETDCLFKTSTLLTGQPVTALCVCCRVRKGVLRLQEGLPLPSGVRACFLRQAPPASRLASSRLPESTHLHS